MRNYIILFICLIIIGLQLSSCRKDVVLYDAEINDSLDIPFILKLNNKICCYDSETNSLRCTIEESEKKDYNPLVEFQTYAAIQFNGQSLANNEINHLGTIKTDTTYNLTIVVNQALNNISLSFTNLPIVQIVSPGKIYNQRKTISKLLIHYPEQDKASDVHFIGIEHRGFVILKYPKKSYGIELKDPSNVNLNTSRSLLDIPAANQWVLDPMYLDKGRMRNKVSFDIWNSMNDNADVFIESEFIELFMNNQHMGIYTFGNKINNELLNLTDPNGILYKTANYDGKTTSFGEYKTTPPNKFEWDGWAQKYPDPDNKVNWSLLDTLRQLTVNASDEAFKQAISSLIDMESFIDYYILINFLIADDNTGKNNFLYSLDGEKLTILPWDLDGALGRHWNGDKNTDSKNSIILDNNLFERLISNNANDFKTALKERWSSLRSNQYSKANLDLILAKNFNELNQSNIIDLENKIWDDDINITTEEVYISYWMGERLTFLDSYFEGL